MVRACSTLTVASRYTFIGALTPWGGGGGGGGRTHGDQVMQGKKRAGEPRRTIIVFRAYISKDETLH